MRALVLPSDQRGIASIEQIAVVALVALAGFGGLSVLGGSMQTDIAGPAAGAPVSVQAGAGAGGTLGELSSDGSGGATSTTVPITLGSQAATGASVRTWRDQTDIPRPSLPTFQGGIDAAADDDARTALFVRSVPQFSESEIKLAFNYWFDRLTPHGQENVRNFFDALAHRPPLQVLFDEAASRDSVIGDLQKRIEAIQAEGINVWNRGDFRKLITERDFRVKYALATPEQQTQIRAFLDAVAAQSNAAIGPTEANPGLDRSLTTMRGGTMGDNLFKRVLAAGKHVDVTDKADFADYNGTNVELDPKLVNDKILPGVLAHELGHALVDVTDSGATIDALPNGIAPMAGEIVAEALASEIAKESGFDRGPSSVTTDKGSLRSMRGALDDILSSDFYVKAYKINLSLITEADRQHAAQVIYEQVVQLTAELGGTVPAEYRP